MKKIKNNNEKHKAKNTIFSGSFSYLQIRTCQFCDIEKESTFFYNKTICRKCYNKQRLITNKQRKEIKKEETLKLEKRIQKEIKKRTKIKRVSNNSKIKDVFERDTFQCKLCGSKEKLECHHIIPHSELPALSSILENLITLCHTCHFQIAHIKGNTKTFDKKIAKKLISLTGLLEVLKN